MSVVLHCTDDRGNESLRFECPGCGELHAPRVKRGPNLNGPLWSWNRSLTAPTLQPSVRTSYTYGPEHKHHCCHFYVTNGQIQFLADCTHQLAGLTVSLPPYKET